MKQLALFETDEPEDCRPPIETAEFRQREAAAGRLNPDLCQRCLNWGCSCRS